MIRPALARMGLACVFPLFFLPACDPPSETDDDVSDTEQNEPGDSDGDLTDTLDPDDLDPDSNSEDTSSELEDTDTDTGTDTEAQNISTDSLDSEGWVDTDSDAEGALYVDVRTAGEYAAGHYPGAIHIPLGSLVERQSELYPKNRLIVVYCASGSRSAKAKIVLEQEGFTNVEDGGALSQLACFFTVEPPFAALLRDANGRPSA